MWFIILQKQKIPKTLMSDKYFKLNPQRTIRRKFKVNDFVVVIMVILLTLYTEKLIDAFTMRDL